MLLISPPKDSHAEKFVNQAAIGTSYFGPKKDALIAIPLSIINIISCPLKGVGECISKATHLDVGGAFKALTLNIWDGIKSIAMTATLIILLAVSFFSCCGNVFRCLKNKEAQSEKSTATNLKTETALESTNSSANRDKATEEKLKADLEEKTKELTTVQADLKDLTHKFNAANLARNEAITSQEKLKEKLEQNKTQMLNLEATYKGLKNQYETVQKQLEITNDTHQADISALHKEIELQKNAANNLQNRTDQAIIEKDELQNKIHHLNDQIAKIQKERAEQAQINITLINQERISLDTLVERDAEIISLKNQIKTLEKRAPLLEISTTNTNPNMHLSAIESLLSPTPTQPQSFIDVAAFNQFTTPTRPTFQGL